MSDRKELDIQDHKDRKVYQSMYLLLLRLLLQTVTSGGTQTSDLYSYITMMVTQHNGFLLLLARV